MNKRGPSSGARHVVQWCAEHLVYPRRDGSWPELGRMGWCCRNVGLAWVIPDAVTPHVSTSWNWGFTPRGNPSIDSNPLRTGRRKQYAVHISLCPLVPLVNYDYPQGKKKRSVLGRTVAWGVILSTRSRNDGIELDRIEGDFLISDR